MTIGGIQAFVSYITFMMWPIQDLARVYAEMQQSIASAERMFSLIDAVPEVRDLPQALSIPVRSLVISNSSMWISITMTINPFYKDFTLKVRQGETIALVGPTGGGKSTIVNLLCRFYEPKSGLIRIGGNDYTQFSLHAIQSRIGIVLQTPHLFSGSIRENIRYGALASHR